MKERGLICQEWEVWAILEKRKTSFRRPVKFPFKTDSERVYGFGSEDKTPYLQYSPYGEPGDRVYVREPFTVVVHDSGFDNGIQPGGDHDFDFGCSLIKYKADESTKVFIHDGDFPEKEEEQARRFNDEEKYFPQIHMPKWATHIWLEITDVRVERVQDITREQIRNEGIVLPFSPRYDNSEMSEIHQEYKNFWNTRYKNWDLNPWTWVYDFKRIDK
jgi:hypothetical protein